MEKDPNSVSLEAMEVIDEIAFRLWTTYVTPEEQADPEVMRNLRLDIETDPYPVNPENPILKRMVEDGAGFDGYNAAMITLSYISSLCSYFEELNS